MFLLFGEMFVYVVICRSWTPKFIVAKVDHSGDESNNKNERTTCSADWINSLRKSGMRIEPSRAREQDFSRGNPESHVSDWLLAEPVIDSSVGKNENVESQVVLQLAR